MSSILASTFLDEIVGNTEKFLQHKKIDLFFFSAPPQNIEISYTHPDSKTVNLTCSAKGVYPKPDLKLTWSYR